MWSVAECLLPASAHVQLALKASKQQWYKMSQRVYESVCVE